MSKQKEYGYDDYTTEENYVFLLFEKVYKLFGRKLNVCFGFDELLNNSFVNIVCKRLNYILFLLNGHYWVWIEKR